MVYQKENLAQNQAIRSANATKKSYFFTKKIALTSNDLLIKDYADSALTYIDLAIQINDSAFKSAYDTCLYAKEQLLTAKDAQVKLKNNLSALSRQNGHFNAGMDLVYLSANAMVDIYDASLHLMRLKSSRNKDHGAMYKDQLSDINEKQIKENIDRNVTRLEVDEHSFITLKELYQQKLTELEMDIVGLESELEVAKNADEKKALQEMIAEKKEERSKLISKYNNAENKLVMVRNELSEEMANIVNKAIFSTDKKDFYNSKVPVPNNNMPIKGLVYRVQVGFFMNELPPEHFDGLFPLTTEKVDNVYIRYVAGAFSNYEDASDAKLAIREKGYSDAFVVAYLDGKKISVAEAIKIENQKQE